jgi:hypothetical protein
LSILCPSSADSNMVRLMMLDGGCMLHKSLPHVKKARHVDNSKYHYFMIQQIKTQQIKTQQIKTQQINWENKVGA